MLDASSQSRPWKPEGAAVPSPVEVELARLETVLSAFRRVLVAFSGGVDSTLVLASAHRVLGDGVAGVTAVSPSLAASERAAARRLAAAIGAGHREIETYEHLNPEYQANTGDRCYHCKSELYDRLARIKEDEGFDAILDGTNVDDLGDDRPGLRAADERDVVHPLVRAGLDKAAVRRLSRHLGLPSWDKPELACLASRLPRGTPVSIERLRRAERAEAGIIALGFRDVRVRDHGDVGKVELGREELGRLDEPGLRDQVIRAVRDAGFGDGVIDPEGYRRGGANLGKTGHSGKAGHGGDGDHGRETGRGGHAVHGGKRDQRDQDGKEEKGDGGQ